MLANMRSTNKDLGAAVGSVPMSRFRCNACGNLTRFDVTTTRRTRAFHHYSVGGELTIEDEEVLADVVEAVSCRWCGNGDAVVEVADVMDGDGGR